MTVKVAGIVLAGGESRRFGSPKAFAKRDGKAFYQYSVDALINNADQIIMITNPQLEKLFQKENVNFDIMNDRKEYKGKGPLAGIYTAMVAIPAKWYVVIPIDVPFIEYKIIRQLIEHIEEDTDAIIPVVSGKAQPLIAIYHYRLKKLIKEHLDGNKLSVQNLMERCKVKYITIQEGRSFYNINQRIDYAKWIMNHDEI